MKEQSPSSSAWINIAASFGFLSFFNIVQHSQSIIDFSVSFVLIAEWWRYLTSFLFLPVPYQMPQLEKDVLTIALLILPVAYRFGFAGKWFDLRAHKRFISKIWDYADGMDSYPTAITLAIAATGMIGVAYGFATGMRLIESFSELTYGLLAVALAVACLLYFHVRPEGSANGESTRLDALLVLVFCLSFPPATIGLVAIAVMASLILIIQFRSAVYRIILLWSCVLIVAWLAGVYLDQYIDPILSDWPRAPKPVA